MRGNLFAPLSYYNASIRHDGYADTPVSEAEVLLPDGTVQKFERRRFSLGRVEYRLETPTGDALFHSFSDLMEKGLGLTKICDGPLVCVIE